MATGLPQQLALLAPGAPMQLRIQRQLTGTAQMQTAARKQHRPRTVTTGCSDDGARDSRKNIFEQAVDKAGELASRNGAPRGSSHAADTASNSKPETWIAGQVEILTARAKEVHSDLQGLLEGSHHLQVDGVDSTEAVSNDGNNGSEKSHGGPLQAARKVTSVLSQSRDGGPASFLEAAAGAVQAASDRTQAAVAQRLPGPAAPGGPGSGSSNSSGQTDFSGSSGGKTSPLDSLGTLVRSFDKRGEDGGVGGMADLTDSRGSSYENDTAGSAARDGRLSWHSAPSAAIAVVERHLLPLAMIASLYAGCAHGQAGSTEAWHVLEALRSGCCLLNSDQAHSLRVD